MARSIRLVAAVIALTMISGRAITAACEVACLNAVPASQTVQSEPTAIRTHDCHDSAQESPAAATRLAARSHDGCHEPAAVPFVLSAKTVRDSLQSGAVALSTSRARAATQPSAEEPREHTPPGLHRAPVVPLRI